MLIYAMNFYYFPFIFFLLSFDKYIDSNRFQIMLFIENITENISLFKAIKLGKKISHPISLT